MKKLMIKNVLPLFLAVLMTAFSFSFATSAEISSDTSWYSDEASVFELNTASELAGLAELVNGGNSFAGKTVRLNNDISFNGGDASGWGTAAPSFTVTPIGSSGKPFSGVFDGNGKTVSGIYMTGGWIGLFGQLNGAEICNLTVDNSYFNGTGTNVGAVAANISGAATAISNVKLTDKVTVKTTQYGGAVIGVAKADVRFESVSFAGEQNASVKHSGLLGVAENCNAVFEKCTSSGNFTAASMGSGFVGTLVTGGSVTVNNCVFSGSLTVNGSTVGAVVAELNGGTVKVNGLRVSASAVSGTGNSVGGIVGFTNGGTEITLKNVVNEAPVSGKDYVGGFIGWSQSKLDIDDCANLGSVTASGNQCGGIVGKANNTSASTVIKNTLNSGEINSARYSGGIIGIIYDMPVRLEACISAGDVKSTGWEAGGLIGTTNNYSVTLNNCVVSGSVTGKSGGTSQGAFLGSAQGTSATEKIIAFNDCYALSGVNSNPTGTWDSVQGNTYVVSYGGKEFGKESFSAKASSGAEALSAITDCFNTDKTFTVDLSVLISESFGDWQYINSESTLPNYPLPEGLNGALGKDMLRGVQTTTPSEKKYSVRFVALVDGLEYEEAGYKITLNGNENAPISCRYVYDKIYGNDDGKLLEYTVTSPELGGKEGQYIFVMTLDDFTVDTEYSLTVTPFVKSSGKIIFGLSESFNLKYDADSDTAVVGG